MAPFAGAILSLDTFSDIVFKDELVGSGLGLRPDEGITELDVLAPMAGTVIKILPHAFILLHDTTGILVHIGIDTVKLQGEGFSAHIEEGQVVEAGDRCFTVQAEVVRSHGFSLDTPIIVMDSPKGTITTERAGDHVHPGYPLFTIPSTIVSH